MAFRDWHWTLKGLVIILAALVLTALIQLGKYAISPRKEVSEVEKDSKTYQLLPIAVLTKPEEYLLDDDLLKDKDGKVIAIKYEALQRIVQPGFFSVDGLRILFEVLAGDEETEATSEVRESLTKLIRKSLLADKELVAQLKGQPGRPGKDSTVDKSDEQIKREITRLSGQVDALANQLENAISITNERLTRLELERPQISESEAVPIKKEYKGMVDIEFK